MPAELCADQSELSAKLLQSIRIIRGLIGIPSPDLSHRYQMMHRSIRIIRGLIQIPFTVLIYRCRTMRNYPRIWPISPNYPRINSDSLHRCQMMRRPIRTIHGLIRIPFTVLVYRFRTMWNYPRIWPINPNYPRINLNSLHCCQMMLRPIRTIRRLLQ